MPGEEEQLKQGGQEKTPDIKNEVVLDPADVAHTQESLKQEDIESSVADTAQIEKVEGEIGKIVAEGVVDSEASDYLKSEFPIDNSVIYFAIKGRKDKPKDPNIVDFSEEERALLVKYVDTKIDAELRQLKKNPRFNAPEPKGIMGRIKQFGSDIADSSGGLPEYQTYKGRKKLYDGLLAVKDDVKVGRVDTVREMVICDNALLAIGQEVAKESDEQSDYEKMRDRQRESMKPVTKALGLSGGEIPAHRASVRRGGGAGGGDLLNTAIRTGTWFGH